MSETIGPMPCAARPLFRSADASRCHAETHRGRGDVEHQYHL